MHRIKYRNMHSISAAVKASISFCTSYSSYVYVTYSPWTNFLTKYAYVKFAINRCIIDTVMKRVL